MVSGQLNRGYRFLASLSRPRENEFFTFVGGTGPLIATAIHDGHELRPEVAAIMKLSDDERSREEDPFTSRWVSVGDSRIVAHRSRFEIDLNRPRDKAVYIEPEDCWGLDVWHQKPSNATVARSLELYDTYYSVLEEHLKGIRKKVDKFVVLDIHSYNHRRGGVGAPPEPASENPEVNVGTGTLPRETWGALVDRFMEDLRSFDFMGRTLDVRENVKFKGGNQVKWVHKNFPGSGCGLAIEFKKFWMDEWTGEPDDKTVDAIRAALSSTIPGLREELNRI